jgi:hypothetical protein
MKLLSIDTNAKTVKGQKKGFMTGILYMAPFTLSGVNLCPMAEKARCFEACLNTAGRGVFNSVKAARLKKAKYFNSDTQAFMIDLARDIRALIRKADRDGYTPVVRLNGTSDIRYENIKFNLDGDMVTIFEAFSDIQFYDYTKISNRKNVPANYDLTYSYSGVAGYQKYVKIAIDAGMRIAAVFRHRADIPKKFLGLRVIDGDDSDLRHLEERGVIVALYAKGRAKKDYSGFVVG